MAAAMDPSSGDLAGFTTIEDLYDWAGINDGPFRESVVEKLGTPTTLKDIALITEGEWTSIIESDFYQPPSVSGQAAPAKTAGTPVHKARLRMCRRAARVALSLPVADDGQARAGTGWAPWAAPPLGQIRPRSASSSPVSWM